MNRLWVVGVGLDGSVSAAAQGILAQSQCLAGSPSHLAHFVSHPAKTLVLSGSVEDWLEQIQATLEVESVTLLATGDPLFFGIGRLLLEIFPREQVVFFPHLSCIQLAFSRIGIPWQTAQIVSLHGRDPSLLDPLLKQGKSPIGVLTDPVHTPEIIAEIIAALQGPVAYKMWVCSRLGSPDERVIGGDPQTFREQTFPEPLVVILEALQDPSPLPAEIPKLGIPDAWFHTYADQPGLMTKCEIRVQILGMLSLTDPVRVVWDVGAGTGSIAIEAARLVPQAQVYAIEKRSAGIRLIQANQQHFGIPNLTIQSGQAPEILRELPDPQRVVVGGGGADLGEILHTIQQRLDPGGILVVSCATLEAATQALQQIQTWGWDPRLTHINIARSAPLAGSTRLSPLNPVFLIAAQQPSKKTAWRLTKRQMV